MSTDANPAVEAAMPIDFSLTNPQGQAVLYTRLISQKLQFEVTNTSRGTITLENPGGADASDTHYYFRLSFRPGTLWEASSVQLDQASQAAWDLYYKNQTNDLTDAFYLVPKEKIPLLPRQSTSLVLTGIAVDGRGGSRGTRVELQYQNLQMTGPGEALSGTRLHYVAVMDETPAADPGSGPLVIDWVGSNTLLNDGSSNQLTLRVMNNTANALTYASAKIDITFPVYSDDTPWGIVSSKPKITIENLKQSRQGAWTRNSDVETNPGVSDTVGLTPDTDLNELQSKEYLDIPIQIIAKAKAGLAHVSVHYEGFSHLTDTVLVPVIKSPLVITDDKVGIGTTPPREKLEIKGNLQVGSARLDGGLTGDVTLKADKGGTSAFRIIGDNALAFWGSGAQSNSPVHLNLDANGNASFSSNVTINGNVGIGTPAAKEKLEINGNLQVGSARLDGGLTGDVTLKADKGGTSAFRIIGDSALAFWGSGAQSDSPAHLNLDAAGNVTISGKLGIGTSASETEFDIYSAEIPGNGKIGANSTKNVLYRDDQGLNAYMSFDTQYGIAPGDKIVINGEEKTITLFSPNGDSQSDFFPPQIRITPDLNEAINTPVAFSYKKRLLYVDDSGVTVHDALKTTNQDLAENYCSDQDLAPAEVVCFDSSRDRIVRSDKPYDLLMAGVVSTNPGVLLNGAGSQETSAPGMLAYPVALCGRVPCKVTDENGPIHRGDLLTTSSTPGHAMKSSPVKIEGLDIHRPGTVIGKALQSHQSGKGIIEIFVTLR